MEFLVFKLVHNASYPFIGYHQEESGSLIPFVYLHMLERATLKPSLLQTNQTQLSQLFLQVFQNLNNLYGLLLDFPTTSVLYW